MSRNRCAAVGRICLQCCIQSGLGVPLSAGEIQSWFAVDATKSRENYRQFVESCLFAKLPLAYCKYLCVDTLPQLGIELIRQCFQDRRQAIEIHTWQKCVRI